MTPNSLILAIDTVLAGTSVALGSGGETRAIECGIPESEQAELLVPAISKLMAECRATGADIDGILVSTGPGGFTGVRVGLSAARALALGWEKPLAGISCFECLGAAARKARPKESGPRIALRKAGGREVVFQSLPPGELFVDSDTPIFKDSITAAAACFGLDSALLKKPGASCVIWTDSGATWWLQEFTPGARQLIAMAPKLPESRWREETAPIYPRPPDARPRSSS